MGYDTQATQEHLVNLLKRTLDKAERQKRQQRETPPDLPSLRGFGITFDLYQGRARNWYQNAGDVKRWADNDEPVEGVQT